MPARSIADLWSDYLAIEHHRQTVLKLERQAWDELEEEDYAHWLHLGALSGVILNLLERQDIILANIWQATTSQGVMPMNENADEDNLPEAGDLPGIIAELGELGPGALVTEEGLACLFDRHPASIKRAVRRRELPPPCRLLGGNIWTAGVLVRHFEKRLEEAAKEAERMAQKLARLSP